MARSAATSLAPRDVGLLPGGEDGERRLREEVAVDRGTEARGARFARGFQELGRGHGAQRSDIVGAEGGGKLPALLFRLRQRDCRQSPQDGSALANRASDQIARQGRRHLRSAERRVWKE